MVEKFGVRRAFVVESVWQEEQLLLVGIVYICETLSDIIQVGYFKLTHGKRIFKMAPLHHHFEMCGWKEKKVVAVFTLVSALACLLALCRRLPQCRDQQRERLWTDPGKMKTLSGATVLVAGAGHIGSWFAGLCRGLGAHTVGLKRDVSRPVEGFDRLAVMEELDGLLPQADVVALMLAVGEKIRPCDEAGTYILKKEEA